MTDQPQRKQNEHEQSPAHETPYVLNEQIGFILRQVQQRHTILFAERFASELTPTQWAAIAKLAEVGEASQNLLGRLCSMDVATIKGVVNRLALRSLLETRPDPQDGRRVLISLSENGWKAYHDYADSAAEASRDTLRPLRPRERQVLLEMLKKLR